MASADGVGEDNFLSHCERVRSEIRTKFVRAHEILQNREADLLAELQRLVDEYTRDGITPQFKELSITKEALRDTLKGIENKLTFEQSAAPVDAHIKELETKLQTAKDTYKSVSLKWDDELEKKLSVAGEILLNAVKSGIRDYKEVGHPIVVFGEHNKGNSPGVFRYPQAIAINPENNSIYICDGGYNRVQVYNKSFEFVFLFNEEMNMPFGICIKQNKVYVTQYRSNCLNVYSTEGKYLNSVGRKGKKKLEFVMPIGLDISTDIDRIYIAESDNNRVQCLNSNLKFISFINNIYGAKDVKLTSDEIVVLTCRALCISLYTLSHQLIRDMIPWGEGNPIVGPFPFILDKSLNILITDVKSHCVCVFSFGGELIHKFGKKGKKRGDFLEPSGIALDAIGRVIVASQNPENCIQIF